MKKALILVLLCFGIIFSTQAQKKAWTLEECVQYAVDNNLNLKQNSNNEELAEIGLRQNRLDLYPSLNASLGENFNFGRSVDPTTNSFENQSINSFNLSASSGVTVFQGFTKQNRIKQSIEDLNVSKLDYKKAQNDLVLSIVQGYLTILFNREQLNTFTTQSEITKRNKENTEKLIRAGSIAESELYTLEAQVAQDEVNIITAQNSLDNSLLDLQLFLELDPSASFDVEIPEIPEPRIEDVDALNPENIINKAFDTQPDMESLDHQLKSAELGVEVAKGNLYPSVNLSGSIGTNQSSLAQEISSTSSLGLLPNGLETESGEQVLQEQFSFETQKTSFGDQMDQNLSQNAGISVRIPVFNGLSSKLGIERAKINLHNVQIQNEQSKKTLKQTIYRAYSDVKASAASYTASKKNVEALERVYDNTEKKFNLGSSTSLEFNTTRDNLLNARSTLVRNKYDFYFKLKILDFYQGEQIRLD